MKKIYYIILSVSALLLASCSFLNIVPTGVATEKDAFASLKAAKKFLYSCYGSMPRPSNTLGSIDFLTGDEVVTPFEHETFANFPKGEYTANNPVISYWSTLFKGIRYCYLLIQNVDKVPGMDPSIAADYKAQAKFLIAYYHYLLIQNYGPTIIIRGVENINQPVEKFKYREPLDVCVKFVSDLLDEAAKELPAERTGNEYGLATSVMAKALKAKLLLMAASPLFNGDTDFMTLKNPAPNNELLMPQEFDQEKWVKALEACKEAVKVANENGFHLYKAVEGGMADAPEPSDLTQRSLRFALLDKTNECEVVWGDTRGQGVYDIQSKSAPYFSGKYCYDGVSPTLAMLKRFYTKNGLPLDEDKTFVPESQWFNTTEVAKGTNPNCEGYVANFNLNREPRFYAWVTFNGGYYEIGGVGNYQDRQKPKNEYNKEFARGLKNGKCVMHFLKNDVAGRGDRNNDYSPTGYLNKKYCDPRKTPDNSHINYIHPYITIADLYLSLAECAVETNDLSLAKQYIDSVRLRAGIPTVDQSWTPELAKHPEMAQTQEGMRQIVRQERMVELYLQNQNFWDMRRWLLADKYFGVQPQGMNVQATQVADFNQIETVNVPRKFTAPANYFMPIPIGEINKNNHLVQNIGY